MALLVALTGVIMVNNSANEQQRAIGAALLSAGISAALQKEGK